MIPKLPVLPNGFRDWGDAGVLAIMGQMLHDADLSPDKPANHVLGLKFPSFFGTQVLERANFRKY